MTFWNGLHVVSIKNTRVPALRAQRSRLLSFVDTVNLPIFIASTNTLSCRFLSVNKSHCIPSHLILFSFICKSSSSSLLLLLLYYCCCYHYHSFVSIDDVLVVKGWQCLWFTKKDLNTLKQTGVIVKLLDVVGLYPTCTWLFHISN